MLVWQCYSIGCHYNKNKLQNEEVRTARGCGNYTVAPNLIEVKISYQTSNCHCPPTHPALWFQLYGTYKYNIEIQTLHRLFYLDKFWREYQYLIHPSSLTIHWGPPVCQASWLTSQTITTEPQPLGRWQWGEEDRQAKHYMQWGMLPGIVGRIERSS